MTKKKIFTTIIDAKRLEQQYWKNLLLYKELFYFLSWKDVLIRYKQTVMGVGWSIIRPFLTMIVFTIVFSKLAKLPSDGTVPYEIMVFVALLPWQFFSNSLQECGNSLVANANMVSKVYFPRMIIPSSAIIVSLVDFFISFVLLLLLMVWF